MDYQVKKSLRLDGYIRVSDTRGREDTLVSPELQRQKLEEYAEANGHTLTLFDPELDVSGGKMKRAVLDQIIERIRTGESDGILVAKLTRFARTLVGGLMVIQEIQEANGTFLSAADDIDFSKTQGKFFLGTLLNMAEWELNRIRDEWSDAQKHAVANGVFTASSGQKGDNGYAPPGYDKGADRKLYPNADAATIKLAFQMRGSGTSFAEIRDLLNKKLPKPNGNEWTSTTAARIFDTRIYRGELIRGEFVNDKACEPIVTEAEWQAANSIPKRSVSRSKQINLLRGLIRCAECGHTMTPTYSGSGKTQTPIYRCRGDHANGRCRNPARIKREEAEAYVESAFLEQLADVELVGNTTSADLEAATAELAELEQELAEFAADTGVRKALGADRYRVAIETRSETIEGVRSRLTALSGQASVDRPTAANYADLDLQDRHAILSGSVDVVLCRGGVRDGSAFDRTRIFWRGELEPDLAFPASW